MRNNKLYVIVTTIFLASIGLVSPAFANNFESNATFQACFTPGGSCTQDIVNAIDSAKQSILVQAYSFTSRPIGHALVNAKARGVDVKIILDRSQANSRNGGGSAHSSAQFFQYKNIPVWIDSSVNIAHNKVMVIDGKTVVTGSFNFTRAAQQDNAENVLIIQSPTLAKQYAQNWNNRLQISQKFVGSENYGGNRPYYDQRSYRPYQRSYQNDNANQNNSSPNLNNTSKIWHQLKQLIGF